MTEVKEAVKKKVTKPKKEEVDVELVKDMAEKISYLWGAMNDHADAINSLEKKLDQVRSRMGLWEYQSI